MKSKIVCVVITLVIMTITGCYYVEDESNAKYDIQKGKKITDNYYYDVEDDFEGMKLNIKLEVNEGKVSYELKDPNGKVQWSNVVEGETTYDEVKEFEKIVGKWTLEFESINNEAEGKMNIKFNKL